MFGVLTPVCSWYQLITDMFAEDPELLSNKKETKQNTVKTSLLNKLTTTSKNNVLIAKIQEAV